MSELHDTHTPPPPPEPNSPMWLPALGVALFVVGGIWWATMAGATPKAAPVNTAASASASASPPVGALREAAPPKPPGH